MKTRITELLGIEHPIVQGGMMRVSRAELASAVSNAGGLGIISALTQSTPEDLEKEIVRCKSMTDKPFGVNLTILPTVKPIPFDEYVDVICNADIKAVETAGQNPEQYIPRFKAAELIHLHKAVTVRHCLKAQQLGVDIVTVDGFECAGHPGEEDIPGLVLIPAAADALEIPILASGGFGDGRGLVAALALGAEGINMGTRFVATREAPVHNNVKQAIVAAAENETDLLYRPLKNTARFLRNSVTQKILEIQRARGNSFQFSDIVDYVKGEKQDLVWYKGDTGAGVLSAGMVCGIIHDIPTCAELIKRIVDDATTIINQRLSALIRAQ
ncbi:MAG: nitronate monooxygenase [Syntrophales bacterium]